MYFFKFHFLPTEIPLSVTGPLIFMLLSRTPPYNTPTLRVDLEPNERARKNPMWHGCWLQPITQVLQFLTRLQKQKLLLPMMWCNENFPPPLIHLNCYMSIHKRRLDLTHMTSSLVFLYFSCIPFRLCFKTLWALIQWLRQNTRSKKQWETTTRRPSFIKMHLSWEQEMKPVSERDVITHTIKHDDSIYLNPNTHTHTSFTSVTSASSCLVVSG